MTAGWRRLTSKAGVAAPGVISRSWVAKNAAMRRKKAARSRSAQAIWLGVCFSPRSVFQMMSALMSARWLCSWSSRSTTKCCERKVRKASPMSPRSGAASSTMQPSSAKRRTAWAQLSRVSRSTGTLPAKSAVKATRFGGSGCATAAAKETAGASKVSGSCGQSPAMVSRKSARSGTLRAIGPWTESGEKRLFEVPRVTRPGDGRMPVTEQ